MYLNPNSLKMHLDQAGKTYDDIKSKLGFSDNTIKQWCNNKKGIGYFNLYKLAEFLDCSADDLTLRDPSAFVGPQKGEKYNNRRYRVNVENLKRIRKERGFTQTTLSQELGFGKGRVHKWESKDARIKARNLEKLADFFKCDMSELAFIDERYPMHKDKAKMAANPYVLPEAKTVTIDNDTNNAVGNLLNAMKDFTSYVSERLDKQQTDIEVLSRNAINRDNNNISTQSMNIGLNENIGKKLLAARYKKNLTVEELSNMSGLSQGSIYKMESNRTPINLNMLEKVINVLGMKLDISDVG